MKKTFFSVDFTTAPNEKEQKASLKRKGIRKNFYNDAASCISQRDENFISELKERISL